MYIEGNIVDVRTGEIYPGRITFSKNIQKIQKVDKEFDTYIVPGFIDAHIRFEDSLLGPIEYAKLALLSGITTVVEDCSGFLQIAGPDSIKYLNNTFSKLPLDYYFLYPLNIEKSKFESGPEDVSHDDFVDILNAKNCLGLTQVDNIRKLKENDPLIMKKISVAKSLDKPIISNISKINFSEIGNFVQLGIRADIGSNIYQEAFEKACYGMKIKIVEGTKRKTLINLVRLAKQFDTSIVSEEKSEQELVKGYLKTTLKKAVSLGLDGVTAIKNVTLNPATMLGIEGGHLSEGQSANIVELEDLKNFNIKRVFYQGQTVVKDEKLKVLKKDAQKEPRFKFDLIDVDAEDLEISSSKEKETGKILCIDEEGSIDVPLTLEKETFEVIEGCVSYEDKESINKVVVASTYGENIISVGFVKGFGLKKGAIGTNLHGSVGNIIVVGKTDEEIAFAINELKNNKGGYIAVDKKRSASIPASVYGVVTSLTPDKLHEDMKKINAFVKRLGCTLNEPFIALGNLMNINKAGYRITDHGLVDTENQQIINVFDE